VLQGGKIAPSILLGPSFFGLRNLEVPEFVKPSIIVNHPPLYNLMLQRITRRFASSGSNVHTVVFMRHGFVSHLFWHAASRDTRQSEEGRASPPHFPAFPPFFFSFIPFTSLRH
jgi:hypothetical protein